MLRLYWGFRNTTATSQKLAQMLRNAEIKRLCRALETPIWSDLFYGVLQWNKRCTPINLNVVLHWSTTKKYAHQILKVCIPFCNLVCNLFNLIYMCNKRLCTRSMKKYQRNTKELWQVNIALFQLDATIVLQKTP